MPKIARMATVPITMPAMAPGARDVLEVIIVVFEPLGEVDIVGCGMHVPEGPIATTLLVSVTLTFDMENSLLS